AGTPPEAMRVLTEAVRKAVQNPEVIATLENTGIVAKFTAPDAFGTIISQEFALWPGLASKLLQPSH
ncbi:MAG TPA: tripartite tricarboxylate transporter substrate binding protein, partial [Bordetella sp.]|nr:tripartite tricarboxylate transporter substrate binding protein [Bordetella sp.]